MLTPAMRERITRVFGSVHSWYGSQEIGGFLAGTLPGSERLACNPLLGWVEILGEDGRPVAPGEQGHVVVTDLGNWVFPFIRYDTEDLAIASGESIGGFPVIELLTGRSSDQLTLASGRVMSGVGFGGIVFVKNGLAPFAHAWQLAQTGPDALELRVMWNEDPTPELISRTEAAAREMADETTQVRVVSVTELEKTPSGKTWLVKKRY
jgi:phenylacetate-CoA ligase